MLQVHTLLLPSGGIAVLLVRQGRHTDLSMTLLDLCSPQLSLRGCNVLLLLFVSFASPQRCSIVWDLTPEGKFICRTYEELAADAEACDEGPTARGIHLTKEQRFWLEHRCNLLSCCRSRLMVQRLSAACWIVPSMALLQAASQMPLLSRCCIL